MKTREQLQAAIARQLGDITRYSPRFPETRTNTWFSMGGRIEPGNGAGYTFMVWRDQNSWYASFPDYHATATVGRLVERDVPYFREKCGSCYPSSSDAEVMVDIIRAVQAIEAEVRANDGTLGDFLDQIKNG